MADLEVEKRGAVGILRLNRPKKLNALNHDMIRGMRSALEEWAADGSVASVVIMGEGPRAFCAGGDIKSFRESALAGGKEVCTFWQDEYSLIDYIGHYPKPYIALTHGIVMGGGLGLVVPGAYRVAASDVVCAMPECGIGFFPDVGASYFLSRAPGKVGMYMALTGARLGRADAVYAGLMTHARERESWPEILQALSEGQSPEAVFPEWVSPGDAPLMALEAEINRIFSAGSVEEILQRLDDTDDEFARNCAKTMRSRSPTSLKLAYMAVRKGHKSTFTECLQTDLRIACRVQAMPDFAEGIRVTVVDKGAEPLWTPAEPEDVTEAALSRFLAPLAEYGLEV